MRSRLLPIACALPALLLAGCGRKTAPVAPLPPGQLPPQVVAVWPAPRDSFVREDVPLLWVRFASPLDSTTVSDRTVYLKLDDTRIPVAVRWEADSNRILIRPLQILGLLKTYSIVLSPVLATPQHVTLGKTYFWQFTTSSLHLPGLPLPANGTAGESPSVMLWWRDDSNTTPGGVGYEVYAGPDSAAVAARAMPWLQRRSGRNFLPVQRWPEDGTVYWSLTALNWTTGERMEGPVWRFTTLGPASARLDSLQLELYRWGHAWERASTLSGCRDADVISGPGYRAGFVWNLPPSSVRLAGARLALVATAAYAAALPTDVSLWAFSREFTSCTFQYNGSPFFDDNRGRLATAAFPEPGRVVFTDEPFACYLEAMIRFGGFYGFGVRSATEVHYMSGGGPDPAYWPRLVLYTWTPNP